jgi:hypothetical protein
MERKRIAPKALRHLLQGANVNARDEALAILVAQQGPLWLRVSSPVPAGNLLANYSRRQQQVERHEIPVSGIAEFVENLRGLASEEPVTFVSGPADAPRVAVFLTANLDRVLGCVLGEPPLTQ